MQGHFVKHTEETKRKISLARKGKGGTPGEKHYNWKGDKVGYWGIHKWISRLLGQPKHCANCETTQAKCFDWANISHTYKRELSDWIRLCRKCHIAYDKGIITL